MTMSMIVSSNKKSSSHSVHPSSHGNQTVGRRRGREFKPQRKRQNQLQYSHNFQQVNNSQARTNFKQCKQDGSSPICQICYSHNFQQMNNS